MQPTGDTPGNFTELQQEIQLRTETEECAKFTCLCWLQRRTSSKHLDRISSDGSYPPKMASDFVDLTFQFPNPDLSKRRRIIKSCHDIEHVLNQASVKLQEVQVS